VSPSVIVLHSSQFGEGVCTCNGDGSPNNPKRISTTSIRGSR
jgi:hypothetical protein